MTRAVADFGAIAHDPARLAGSLIEFLFVIDVQIAMVGYLLTMRPLDAHIRTANPYMQGWVAALMLVMFHGVVFAGVQFAVAVMALAEDQGPRGGKLIPIRVEATVPRKRR